MTKLRRALQGVLLVALASLFAFALPAHAGTTRSCDAHYQWETTGGTFGGVFERFTGRGSCGNSVPNRCRKRARDAAMGCMSTHWDIRWEKRRPEACLNAAGVYGYDLGIDACTSTPPDSPMPKTCLSPKNEVPQGDLKKRLEVEVCCAFGAPIHPEQETLRNAKNVHVRLKAVTKGKNKHCNGTKTLVNDYVIKDCSAIWNGICKQQQ